MRRGFIAAAAAALASCASAPIVQTGPDEYEIGAAGKDASHTGNTNWQRHHARAEAYCSGRGQMYRAIDMAKPDEKFHFGCSNPPPPPPPPPPPVYATPDEMQAARAAWRDCLEAAEPPIDDMISDASTVATALATRCEDEFAELVRLTQKGHGTNFPIASFSAPRRSVALDVVLRVRAKRRATGAQPPPIKIPQLTPEKL